MAIGEPAMLFPESLGLVELTHPPASPAETLCDKTSITSTVIRALPLLSGQEKLDRLHHAMQTLLKMVGCGNFQQAYQHYRKENAKSVSGSFKIHDLLTLVEHLLAHQCYTEARGLIAASNSRLGIHKDPIAVTHLRTLASICETITGNSQTSNSQVSASSLWRSGQGCSQNLRALLFECLFISAKHEMAMGRRKAAIKILDSLVAKEQHHNPAHESTIGILRQVCGYGTIKSAQSHLLKSARKRTHLKYSAKFACAVDSVVVYNNGEIIVINGWYLGDSSAEVSISLAKNGRLLTALPCLIHRFRRGDLVPVSVRYGMAEDTLSGFSCTFVPEESAQISLDWFDGEFSDVILTTKSASTTLIRKPLYKELTLDIVRNIIRQIMTDDCQLSDYICARRLKNIWAREIASRTTQEVEYYSFGSNCNSPDVSILIPLYGRIDFMEFQLHWFYCQMRGSEGFRFSYQIIYCLDDPDKKDSLLQLAHKCAMLYEIPFEIVINAANLGFSASNNVAAKYARASTLLLLNSDVLPRDHNAIDTLVSCYQNLPSNRGVLGAKLLYPSGDIQHVGISFYKNPGLPGVLSSCWLNEHPHKFIKHTSNPKLQAGTIESEAATAACLLIGRDIFDELDGFRLDYITGDFEDSDLCLRIRRLGRSVLICLDAVFFHLERQSMILQAEHGQDALKLVAFNAYTHHERHTDIIEDIKSRLAAPF